MLWPRRIARVCEFYVATVDVFFCTRVESEPATVRPLHNEFLLWSGGLVWCEEYLFAERGDLMFEWLPLMRWCAVIPSPPIWKVVCVHAACRTHHFKTELSRSTGAPICRSVKSLIARICPCIVWLARSMLPLELMSPTGLPSQTISVGMWLRTSCSSVLVGVC